MSQEAGTTTRLFAARRTAKQPNFAALKRGESGQNTQQGCLPCSVSSEESAAGALVNRQSAIAECCVIAVELPDALQLDFRHSRSSLLGVRGTHRGASKQHHESDSKNAESQAHQP